MKVYFQIAECSISYAKILQASAMKVTFRLPSAAYLMQRYTKIQIKQRKVVVFLKKTFLFILSLEKSSTFVPN